MGIRSGVRMDAGYEHVLCPVGITMMREGELLACNKIKKVVKYTKYRRIFIMSLIAN